MIEIKNTKVRLYTLEEYKKKVNVTTLRPEIEETLTKIDGRDILLYSQVLKDKYSGIIVMWNSTKLVDIYECMIKEVITDKPKIRKHCTNCRPEPVKVKYYYVVYSYRDDFLNLHIESFYDYPFRKVTKSNLDDFLKGIHQEAGNYGPILEFRVISWQEIEVD